jgi:type IV secretion system protein VirB1
MALFIDLAAQCAPQVPPELLAAIATIESGRQPLAVQAGGTLQIAQSAGEAVALLVGALDGGADAQAGLMGLDAHTLLADGVSLAESFDACRNLGTAGRILDALWKAAERSGLSPSNAERKAVRQYFLRSRTGVAASQAYEARVMAEKRRLAPGIGALTIPAVPPAGPKSPRPVTSGSLAVHRLEPGKPSPRDVSASSPERRALDLAIGTPATGLVVFSK